jgi:hypothetical protein
LWIDEQVQADNVGLEAVEHTFDIALADDDGCDAFEVVDNNSVDPVALDDGRSVADDRETAAAVVVVVYDGNIAAAVVYSRAAVAFEADELAEPPELEVVDDNSSVVWDTSQSLECKRLVLAKAHNAVDSSNDHDDPVLRALSKIELLSILNIAVRELVSAKRISMALELSTQ